MTGLRAAFSQLFFPGSYGASKKGEDYVPSALEFAHQSFRDNTLTKASYAVFELGSLVQNHDYLAPPTLNLAADLVDRAKAAAQKDEIAATSETRLIVVGIRSFARAFQALPATDINELLQSRTFFAATVVPLAEKFPKKDGFGPSYNSMREWLQTSLRLSQISLHNAWPELAEPPLDILPFDYAPERKAKAPTRAEVLALHRK